MKREMIGKTVLKARMVLNSTLCYDIEKEAQEAQLDVFAVCPLAMVYRKSLKLGG